MKRSGAAAQAGCARCASLLEGLRATRRVATLPIEAPSAGFEERILTAARDAEQSIRPKITLGEVISIGGRWAMRPQTAMAAVFLVIDVLGYRKLAFPLSVIGMNALAVYMATEMFDFRKIGDVFVGHLLPRVGRWDLFLGESTAFIIIWLILYWMFRRKLFLRI